MQQDNIKIIRHTITRLLARREHSFTELLSKLKLRELPESESLIVADEFRKANIQSDLRFAESVVRGAQNKGKGPAFIRRTLQQHDIEPSIMNSYMLEERFDWYELAKNTRSKRFGSLIPDDFKQIQKQKRFLHFRGFDEEQIRYAFDKD